MTKLKIAHLTSAHPRYDTRIFIKMCLSLVESGHDVTLIVADGKGDEFKDNLKICANNPSKESAEEEVLVEYSGDSFEIGFNISYVQESLSVISNNEVEFVFFGSENSCLVKNIDDESLIHVIMPMRL